MDATTFYIGTRADRCDQIRGTRLELKQAGWVSTYDWEPYLYGDEDKHRETGNAERDGVISANVVCISLPGGYGSHVEFGMALARNRISGGRNLLVLHAERESDFDPYGEGKPSPFYYCDGVNRLICPLDALAKNLLMVYKQYSARFNAALRP